MRRSAPLVLLALLAVLALPAGPASADTSPLTTALAPADFRVAPEVGGLFEGTAGQTGDLRTGLGLWRDGTAYAGVALAGTGFDDQQRLMVEAGADTCEGGALMVVRADGVEVLRQVVDVERGSYLLAGSYPRGVRALSISFVGDHRTAGCDRGLKVYGVAYPPSYGTGNLVLGPGSLPVQPATSAYTRQVDNGAERVLEADGTLSREFTSQQLRQAHLYVDESGHWPRGTWCATHPPVVTVRLDGRSVGALHPTSSGRAPGDPPQDAYGGGRAWEGLALSPLLPAGPHLLQVAAAFPTAPSGEDCPRAVGVFGLTVAAAQA